MAAPLKCLRNMMKFTLPIHGYGAGYPCSPVDSHAYAFDWIWEVVLVKLLLIPARLRWAHLVMNVVFNLIFQIIGMQG